MRKLKGGTVTFEIFHVLKYDPRYENGATAYRLWKEGEWRTQTAMRRSELRWNAGHVWNALKRLARRGWVIRWSDGRGKTIWIAKDNFTKEYERNSRKAIQQVFEERKRVEG